MMTEKMTKKRRRVWNLVLSLLVAVLVGAVAAYATDILDIGTSNDKVSTSSIETDANNRFVTDLQINLWTGKQDSLSFLGSGTKVLTSNISSNPLSNVCLELDANGRVVVASSGLPCGTGSGGGGSSAFNSLTSGTNITATMLIGTGASMGVTGSGTISATNAATQTQGDNSTKIATTAYVDTGLGGKAASSHTHNGSAITGGTIGASYLPSNSSSGAGIVSSASGKVNKVWKTDSNGNPDWRDDSTGGSPTFDSMASGTNTTAAMLVGTGASLGATGTGTITATNAATQSQADNSTKIATTAYVDTGLSGKAATSHNHAGSAITSGTVGASYLPANSNASGGIVSSGSGQVNKVWKTDASGNPDWRDDSTVGNPAFSTLASGTNTTAAMLVGTGGSLGASGSGTITATGLSGTPALPNGTTATTQSQADNSTKIATTAYVDTGLSTKASVLVVAVAGDVTMPTPYNGMRIAYDLSHTSGIVNLKPSAATGIITYNGVALDAGEWLVCDYATAGNGVVEVVGVDSTHYDVKGPAGYASSGIPQSGRTYYIGRDKTYTTFAALVAAVTLQPGDVVDGSNETFRERVTVGVSGSSSGYITIQNAKFLGSDALTGWTNAGSNVWTKTVTTGPNIVALDGTLCTKQANVGAVNAVNTWFWDSGTHLLSVYSFTDPSNHIEVGQRSKIFSLDGKSYIKFKNVTVQYDSTSNVSGMEDYVGAIYANNASHHLVFDGCSVLDNPMNGMKFDGCHDIEVKNCTITNNGRYAVGAGLTAVAANGVVVNSGVTTLNFTFTNNVMSRNGWAGLYIFPWDKATPCTNVVIKNNTLNYNIGAGIYLDHSDTVDISYNTIDGNGIGGMGVEPYGIGVRGSDNVEIHHNTIRNTQTNDAIQVHADALGGTPGQSGYCHTVLIHHNLITDTLNGDCIGVTTKGSQTFTGLKIYRNVLANSGGTNAGIRFYTEDSGVWAAVEVTNNTIYGNNWALHTGTVGGSANVPLTLKNNIIMSSNTPAVEFSVATTGLTTANNLWYRASGNVLGYNSSYYSTGTITNFEASAQHADPVFVNVPGNDYHLQVSSPAIDHGATVAGVTTVYRGAAPDIGAFEY